MGMAIPTLDYETRTAAVLALRAEGLSSRQIAERIGIDTSTVSALECAARRAPASAPRIVEARTSKVFAPADDPCLRCALPDCDDKDMGCGLRRLYRAYEHKRKNGRLDEVTEAERIGYGLMFKAWVIDRKAEAAEGGRPFRRGAHVWGTEASA